MGDLDADLLGLRVGEGDDVGKGCDVGVGPDTQVFRRDTAFWYDGGCLDDCKTRSSGKNATNYREIEI